MSDLSAISLRPGDEGYDAAATVYMRTGTPSVVVQVREPADVAAAVQHAVTEGLPVALRCGGHSGQAWGTNDGGLVVDLSALDSVEVLDAQSGHVRVGGGAQWGKVATTLAEHGLALTSGDTVSVGVGGLTTGGGIGWMVRKDGLTIDNLIAAEVVTADGRVLRASATEHPDLFWAIRGGGGNFGVVTSFEYVARPLATVHAGMIMYAVDDVPTLLKGWAEAHRAGPEELNSTLVLAPAMGEMMPQPSAMGLVLYAGSDKAAADAAFAPLLSLGTVTMSDITEKPYPDVLEEAHPPPGVKAMASSTLLRSLDDEAIAAISEWYAGGTAGRMSFIRALGGAVNRVPPDATAFAHRDVEALVLGGLFRPEGTPDEEMLAELRPFDSLHALGTGSYAGFLLTNTPEDLGRVYPPATMERLREVKRSYDPGNVFRANFNIEP